MRWRDRAGGQPAWLGVPDCAANAPADVEADLGQLGRLARPGLAGHDDNLVRGYGGGDLMTPLADRKVWVCDRRERRPAGWRPALRPRPSVRRAAAIFSGFAPRRFFSRLPSRAASRMVSPSRRLRRSATDGSATPETIGAIRPRPTPWPARAHRGRIRRAHRAPSMPSRAPHGRSTPCRRRRRSA